MMALPHFLFKIMVSQVFMKFHHMIGLRHMMEICHETKFHHKFGYARTRNDLTAGESPDGRSSYDGNQPYQQKCTRTDLDLDLEQPFWPLSAYLHLG